MAKSCPKGQYYCYTDKKCKKIPKGYVIGARGYLRQEPQDDDSKKNGNGNGNGHSKSNGSGGNGSGNGNGGNGGNGGGGGMSEATMTSSQKRKDTMLKKKYDDSDMKKNMKKQYGKEEGEKVYYATIRKQAMEQKRNPNTGLPMGMKSTDSKKDDKKMKSVPYEMLRAHLEIPVTDIQVSTMDELTDYKSFAQKAQEARDKKQKERGEKIKADKEYMAKKKERVQKGIKFYDTKGKGYMKGGVKTYEETLDEISPANPTRIKRPNPYSVKNKLKMAIKSVAAGPIKEEQPVYSTKEFTKFGRSNYPKNTPYVIDDFIKNRAKELFKFKTGIPLAKNMKTEGSLHKWFKGSKSKDGKPGWVNVKTGGTCASDEPGEGTPKCVSSSKRASMSKSERESASRRKKAADPNQQSKSGAAKPTYVSTDKKKVKKESIDLSEMGKKFGSGNPSGKIDKAAQLKALKKLNANIPVKKIDTDVNMEDARSIFSTPALDKLKKLKDFQKNADKVFGRETKPLQSDYKPEGESIEEADKKGKGSGTKDACYHKVKSRYSVWPSAYASGALVKCRKVGAANWGNSKKEEFEGNVSYSSFMEKCWKGYEKKGMKTMFGKRYPNCVKKEEVEIEEDSRLTSSNSMQSKMYADKNKSGKKMSDDEIKKEKGGSDFLARIKAAKEKMKNEGSSYGMYKGDGKPKGPMANFGDDKKKKKKSYEEFQQECWKTHKQVGYKKKGGKMVPNCVPKNEEVEITDAKKLSEDDMKGMSVSSGHKRPTKSGAGMTAKGIAAYRRRNPGSKLKGAVTGKVKKGSKAAGRRKSYCARSAGQMKKFPKAAKDPNSRLRQARRRWKC